MVRADASPSASVVGRLTQYQRVVRTQDDVEIFAYPVGVTVVGSVEMTLE